jgi:hypothetical protein
VSASVRGKDTGIQLTLANSKEWSRDGQHFRREEWTITGGEIDPTWLPTVRAAGGGEPSSRFTLYVIDGEVDPQLASYDGVVWPTAWPALFRAFRQGRHQAVVEITDKGLEFRAAALHGASDMYADVRLLP